MTRCVHRHDQDNNNCNPGGGNCDVVIYLSVVQDSAGNYRWSYLPLYLPLNAGQTKITIELKYTPIDNSSASLAGYASTGFNHGHSPVKQADEPNSAYLCMLPHQIIDFGVFVAVTGGLNPTTIFCDPQASNDPKVSVL